MKKKSPTARKSAELYGIAAVARQAGLTAPVIRMWEKRYAAVTSKRSSTQRRLYDTMDVERLRLLHKLTGHGHAIHTIATLSLAQLQRRLVEAEALLPAALHPGAGSLKRLLFVGAGLEVLLGELELLEGQAVGKLKNLETAKNSPRLPKADLLVVETETLIPETLVLLRDVVKRSKAPRTILIYRFTPSDTFVAITKMIEGLCPLKSPVSASQLRRECVVQLNRLDEQRQLPDPPGGTGQIPERIYEASQLERLVQVSTAVKCECPRHMAELLQGLCAFERYSEQCEDRNAADALLHDFLHRSTAHVRRLMEEALRHVVRMEGIKI